MHYGHLRWIDVENLDKDQVVVVCPLASMEQHGHHLPLLTDTLLVTGVAEGMHERLGDRMLLLPTQWLGASDHHADFPGTVSVSNEHFARTVKSLTASLVSAGFWKILFLNGHGGNDAPGETAITQMADDSDECNEAYVVLASYWRLAAQAMAADRHGMTQPSLSHACEYETSLMLHLHPELVQMEAAVGGDADQPDVPTGVRIAGRFNLRSETGALGSPDLATAEKGASLLAAIVDATADFVDQMSQWPERVVVGPMDPE
ncbi:MAG: creatininase family protein [Planctomycetales bacterium]|nr:creatininase family protein [Planctomycetales bacterium]